MTVVALDDVQWLGAASAATLSCAIRRLDRKPVTLLHARRVEDEEPLPLDLDRVARERVWVLRRSGLTTGALGLIMRERLGISYPRTTLRRLHEVSAGPAAG